MEKKLEEYRRRKRREETIENIKARLRKMFLPYSTEKTDTHIQIPEVESSTKKTKQRLESPVTSSDDEEEDEEDEAEPVAPSKTWIDYVTYLIYFLFWATVYAIAIQVKFGTVYFMFSCLVGIYLNTRTRPKLKNEPSAYSVFNKNVESIDGTLKAEQFEREIGLRPK